MSKTRRNAENSELNTLPADTNVPVPDPVNDQPLTSLEFELQSVPWNQPVEVVGEYIPTALNVEVLSVPKLASATISELVDRYISSATTGYHTLNVTWVPSKPSLVLKLSSKTSALDVSNALPYHQVGLRAPEDTRLFGSWAEYFNDYLSTELTYLAAQYKVQLQIN